MKLTTLSSKGQVTVPKSIRELLNIHAGDRLAFIVDRGDVYLQKVDVVISEPDMKESS